MTPQPGCVNHRVDVAYVGSRYHGWQIQPGRPTIQGVLAGRLTELYGMAVVPTGAGRTDAGVHALRQVAHFFAPPLIPSDRLPEAINCRIPDDIRVLGAGRANPEFHARRSASSKIYQYRVYTGTTVDPFCAPFVHHLRAPLDLPDMEEAARHLLGVHDFSSFCAHARETEACGHVRNVLRLSVRGRGHLVTVTVEADGFLHHMVRNIVGTLLQVGAGKVPPGSVRRVLDSRDRRNAGPTAPARGLRLCRVVYGRGLRAQ